MRKKLAAALCFILALMLSGCGKYVSSYKAVGLVHSSDDTSLHMSLMSFTGRMVFMLRSTDKCALHYTADLESGNAVVYYDCGGMKKELFSLNGGDVIDSRGGDIAPGPVYIIIETGGECQNGEFHISLD